MDSRDALDTLFSVCKNQYERAGLGGMQRTGADEGLRRVCFLIGFLNVNMRKRKKKSVLCSLLMSLFKGVDFILKIKDLE